MTFDIEHYYMTNSYRPGLKNLIGSKPVCKSPYSPGCPAPMFAESVHRVNTTNKLKQCGSGKALQRDYRV